jgi:hypothetical protein
LHKKEESVLIFILDLSTYILERRMDLGKEIVWVRTIKIGLSHPEEQFSWFWKGQ